MSRKSERLTWAERCDMLGTCNPEQSETFKALAKQLRNADTTIVRLRAEAKGTSQ